MDIKITDSMIKEISEREISKRVNKYFDKLEDHAKTHFHTDLHRLLGETFEKVIKERYKDLIEGMAKEVVPDTFAKMIASQFLNRLQEASLDNYVESDDWD